MYHLPGVQPLLFTGDTLFCGGCGAPMEGSLDDMHQAFARIWRLLSPTPNALIFPGHEYTEVLLGSSIGDPGPQVVKASHYARLAAVHLKARRRRATRGLPLPTVPTQLMDELAFNPTFSDLHDSAAIIADAWRHSVSRRRGVTVKPPPPSDGPDFIPSVHPSDALTLDAVPPSHPAAAAAAAADDDVVAHERHGLILVSRDSLGALCDCIGVGDEDPADSQRGQEAATIISGWRARRVLAEVAADDWAARRPRRLRSFLVERRRIGEAHVEQDVRAALSHFVEPGHNRISRAALLRALTTLGVDKAMDQAEAHEMLDEVAAALEGLPQPEEVPPGYLRLEAIVDLIAAPGAPVADVDEPRTLVDRVVRLLARARPMRDGASSPGPGAATRLSNDENNGPAATHAGEHVEMRLDSEPASGRGSLHGRGAVDEGLPPTRV